MSPSAVAAAQAEAEAAGSAEGAEAREHSGPHCAAAGPTANGTESGDSGEVGVSGRAEGAQGEKVVEGGGLEELGERSAAPPEATESLPPLSAAPPPPASKPPVAPAALNLSPRVGVVPPKFSDNKGLVSKYSLPRHNGLHSLALQPSRGSTPNQSLLDSPVLLPVPVTAEPSPTTGFATPPLFQNSAVPKVVGGDSVEKKWRINPSTLGQEASKQPIQRATSHRPTDDGYHWRKYGEKRVKGSPYPRSYYKCSHPGCPVRKVVETNRDTGTVKDNLYKGTHTHGAPVPHKVPSSMAAKAGPAASVAAKQAANVMSAMSSARSGGNGEADVSSGSQQALENLRREGAFFSPKSPRVNLEVLTALASGSAPSSTDPCSSTNPLLPVEPLSRNGSAAIDAPTSTSSAPPTPMGTPSKSDRPLALPDAIPLQPGVLSSPSAPMFTNGSGAVQGLRAAVQEAGGSRGERGVKMGSESGKDWGGSLKRAAGVSVGGREWSQASPVSKRRKSSVGAARPETPVEEEESAGVPELYEALPGRLADMQEAGVGPDGREAKLVMWIQTDMDILEDGYRWRKYGQKIVRNNPFPRSYYKCTQAGCAVRKHLERNGKDSSCVVVTYEGVHCHAMPEGSAAGGKKSARKRTDSSTRRCAREAEQAAALEAAENEAAAALTIIASPRTPKVARRAANGLLPMMSLSDYDMGNFNEDTAATVLRTMSPTPSKKTLNLDFTMANRSVDRKSAPTVSMVEGGARENANGNEVNAAGKVELEFSAVGEGSGAEVTPKKQTTWDHTGFLATPKSPANIMLRTPPSALTPPKGLSIPTAEIPSMQSLEK